MNKTLLKSTALAAAMLAPASGFAAADSPNPGDSWDNPQTATQPVTQIAKLQANRRALPLTLTRENTLRNDDDRYTAADFEINTMAFILDDSSELRVYMRPETIGKVSEDLESINFQGGNQSVIIPTARIAEIRYVFDEADVKQIDADKQQYSLSEGRVEFHNLPAGSHAIIADIEGNVFFSANIEKEWSHSLADYPAGIYIVNVNSTSLKFIIK